MAKYTGHSKLEVADYMGAWHYVGLGILYSIPVIGLLFLIIHALSRKNKNRMHYARSFFCGFIVFALLAAAGFLVYEVGVVLGNREITGFFTNLWDNIVASYNSIVNIFVH